jgi:hypothetical protein
MRSLPDLSPDDVDELEQLIRHGRLPVRMPGEFEKDEKTKRTTGDDVLAGHQRFQ